MSFSSALIRLLSVVAIWCLSACGDAKPDPNGGKTLPPLDMRPETIAGDKTSWQVNDGGLANQRGGLIIDIANGGHLRRTVNREVRPDTDLQLVMRADANGEQRLELIFMNGCGRSSHSEAHAQDVYLKNGFNRVDISFTPEARHDCLTLELNARYGPISVFIEDATLNWKN